MTTTLSPNGEVKRRAKTGPLGSGWSYIYVGFWLIWYTLKSKLGFLVAAVIFLLSVIELFGPATHLMLEASCSTGEPCFWRATWFHDVIAFVLFITAVALILHHNRLNEKVKKYRNLLTFATVFADSSDEISDLSPQAAAGAILDALVRALERPGMKSRSKNQINATILTRTGRDGAPFRIFAQDSSTPFSYELEIPAESVAGKVVRFDSERGRVGALMYVPSTKHVHGIAFEKGTFAEGREIVRGAEIVPATYRVVDEATETEVLKCLLCIQIPLRQPRDEYDESAVCAVLSLSGRKADCMDIVSFSAAKLASALLADTMVRDV